MEDPNVIDKESNIQQEPNLDRNSNLSVRKVEISNLSLIEEILSDDIDSVVEQDVPLPGGFAGSLL